MEKSRTANVQRQTYNGRPTTADVWGGKPRIWRTILQVSNNQARKHQKKLKKSYKGNECITTRPTSTSNAQPPTLNPQHPRPTSTSNTTSDAQPPTPRSTLSPNADPQRRPRTRRGPWLTIARAISGSRYATFLISLNVIVLCFVEHAC